MSQAQQGLPGFGSHLNPEQSIQFLCRVPNGRNEYEGYDAPRTLDFSGLIPVVASMESALLAGNVRMKVYGHVGTDAYMEQGADDQYRAFFAPDTTGFDADYMPPHLVQGAIDRLPVPIEYVPIGLLFQTTQIDARTFMFAALSTIAREQDNGGKLYLPSSVIVAPGVIHAFFGSVWNQYRRETRWRMIGKYGLPCMPDDVLCHDFTATGATRFASYFGDNWSQYRNPGEVSEQVREVLADYGVIYYGQNATQPSFTVTQQN